jgi:hypothetical protein
LTDTVVHATTTDITSELTEHTDLIVPAIATSSSSNVDHIDDLVVPPFTDEMIAHDSQAPIVPAL